METFLTRSGRDVSLPKIDSKHHFLQHYVYTHIMRNKRGKQGIVGIFESTHPSPSSPPHSEIVFKCSRYIDHATEHESLILHDTTKLFTFAPFFLRKIYDDYFTVNPYTLSSSIDDRESPFILEEDERPNQNENKHKLQHPPSPGSNKPFTINSHILFTEYLDNACKLSSVIRSPKASMDQLVSLLKQTLIAMIIGYNNVQLTHYDLHSDNIMVQRTHKDSVILYVHDETTHFVIPTLGMYPILIDYGFAFSTNINARPAYSTLAHTDIGFTSMVEDPFADPRLFLVSVSSEIKDKRRDKQEARKLRRIVKNIFEPLMVDWDSGWECSEDIAIIDELTSVFDDEEEEEDYDNHHRPHKSHHHKQTPESLFDRYRGYCLELIQSIETSETITNTLTYNNPSISTSANANSNTNTFDKLRMAYRVFTREFSHIERLIRGDFFLLHILKKIVSIARPLKPLFMVSSTKSQAIKSFTDQLFIFLRQHVTFCNPKIRYENLLCALFLLSEQIVKYEGMLLSSYINKRKLTHQHLKLQNIEQMFDAIDINIPTPYTFTPLTQIFVIDNVRKHMIQLTKPLTPDECLTLNNTPFSYKRQQYLYHTYIQEFS